jgi:predicted O-methyltransferase YrrM
LPPATELDGPAARVLESDLVGDEQHVRQLLRYAGTPLDRVHIVAGWFHETLARAPISRVALLHLDVDWYESYKLCLNHFYDALEPGGVVVLDDFEIWPGCRAAVE